jgi:antirestriction protein ArdC
MRDVYQNVTDRIVQALENGTVPWRQTWGSTGGGLPANLISRRPYRGINAFLLSLTGFSQPYFLTFNQAKLFGGHVRQGEHGHRVILWKWLEKQDEETGKRERVPLLREFTVFHYSQCELPAKIIPVLTEQHRRTFNPLEQCEKIMREMPSAPAIHHGSDGAFYRPSTDEVWMPERERFEGEAEYYGVAFHELGHATGHASRLNRSGIIEGARFGSATYSREELIAELCSGFICAHCGIDAPLIENSAAYIAGWLKVLKGDSKLLVQAAAQAQRAADFILGTRYDEADESKE